MTYNKNIISLNAFLQDNKYIIDIIKTCQLKYTDDWKIWTDDYGNTLSLNWKRNASIKLNDSIDLQTINSKDLYFKAHINKLSSINKFSLISIKDDVYYLWMLDENNILRLCVYINNILMENQPILISGLKNLKLIIENAKIDGWAETDSIVEPLTGSKMEKSWFTSWPPRSDLIILLPEVIKNIIK